MTTRDFSGLCEAIKGWLHRTNPTLVAQIPTFLMLAESRIYRKLRVRGMETAFEVTTSGGTAALPERYAGLKHLRIDGRRPLERKSAAWIYDQHPATAGGGTPAYFARDREELIFGPAPVDGLVLKGTYYRLPEPLGEAQPTNWFAENAFDLLMFGALCEAAPYMANDARIPIWEAKFGALLADIQTESDDEESSGPGLSLSIR